MWSVWVWPIKNLVYILGVAPSQVPVTFSDHYIFSRKSPKSLHLPLLQCYSAGWVPVCKLFWCKKTSTYKLISSLTYRGQLWKRHHDPRKKRPVHTLSAWMIIKCSRISSLEVLDPAKGFGKKRCWFSTVFFWRIRVEKPPPKMDIHIHWFFWCDKLQIWKVWVIRFSNFKIQIASGRGEKEHHELFCVFRMAGVHEGLHPLPSSWYALMRGADDHPLVFEPRCPDLNSWMGLIFWKVEQRWW